MKRKRSRLELDERKEKLLDLGVALFGTHPYDDLSIEKIAKHAKISKGLLYHYFPTKRDFCIATIKEISQAFIRKTTLREDIPAMERLKTTLTAYFTYAENHPEAFLALYRSGIASDPEVQKILEEIRQISVKRLAQGLNLSKPSPGMQNILFSCVCFIESSALFWLGQEKVSRSSLVDGLTASISAMLAAALNSEI